MSEEPSLEETHTQSASNSVLFLEVLRAISGSQEETLQFIKQKTEEAGFEFKIFSRVPRLENGKNPYGLNGWYGSHD